MTLSLKTLHTFAALESVIASLRPGSSLCESAHRLAEDITRPKEYWGADDFRRVCLRARIHDVYDRAVSAGLTRNFRFNASWDAVLKVSLNMGILTRAED